MAKISLISFFLILALSISLRLYNVTKVPPHLYWDEAGISFNSFSINETGKDEWGKSYPFLFRSFGDYKLPLYIYATALSQKLFGLNDFSVRAPSILSGVLVTALVFFLTFELILLAKKKYQNDLRFQDPWSFSLIAMLLIAISPWQLQFTRAGFEASLSLLFQIAGVWLFLLAVRKNICFLFVSAFFFALSYFTYHAALVSTTLLMFLLCLLFIKFLLEKIKLVSLTILFFFVLMIPFFAGYLFDQNGQTRARTENVFNMKGNPLINLSTNYASSFSFDFLFFKGDQNGRHSVKKIGELYLWQLPFVLAGLYFLLKHRSKGTTIILMMLLIGALPPGLTLVAPHSLRGFLASVPLQIICSAGIVFAYYRLRILRLFLPPIIAFSVFSYLHLYYVFYPRAYEADWQSGRKEAVQFLSKVEKNYDEIFLTPDLEPIYLYLYLPVKPALVQNSKQHNSVGKFVYTDLSKSPKKLMERENALIVAPGWMSPNTSLVLKRAILDKSNNILYRIYEY